MKVRLATQDEVPVLRSIERASGEGFRQYGLDDVADAEPSSAAALFSYVEDGRAWTVVDDHDVPVGYLIIDLLDGAAHIQQVSVVPSEQGRGLGRSLIDTAETWARSHGASALTLSTFDHIPWNRPLYEHLGFSVVPEPELTPGLRAIRAAETAQGLDPARRVVMRRALAS